MAMEPIDIFSRRLDPRGVVALLRSLSPVVWVTGPDDAWEEAEATFERVQVGRQSTICPRGVGDANI